MCIYTENCKSDVRMKTGLVALSGDYCDTMGALSAHEAVSFYQDVGRNFCLERFVDTRSLYLCHYFAILDLWPLLFHPFPM